MSSAPDTAAPRTSVRVRTEVAALTRTFDYSVPGGWRGDHVVAGSRVRVPLHGRTVRGWVVGDGGEAPAGVEVVPLKSWLGWGPPPALVGLAEWAAWRWAGPMSFFLNSASPSTVVRDLPTPPAPGRDPGAPSREPDADGAENGGLAARLWAQADRGSATVVRLPPATDLIDLVLAVATDPVVAARPRRGTGAGPLDGMGRAPGRTAAAPGARQPRPRGPRHAPAGRWWSGPGPAPGPRCPRSPPRWCSMRTIPPTGRRARPPTARSTSWSSGRAVKGLRACWCPRFPR